MKKEVNPDAAEDLPDEPTDDAMRAEYDFSRGVRGKYAKELKDQGCTIRVDDADGGYTERIVPGDKVVVLEPDVWEYFPDSETVQRMSNNELITGYVTIVERQETTSGAGCYLAYHPELPTCLGQGATPEEAIADLAEATELVLEYLGAQGLPIPDPQSALLTGSIQKSGVNFSTQATMLAPSIGLHRLHVGVA